MKEIKMGLKIVERNDRNVFTIKSNELNERVQNSPPKDGWLRFVVYNHDLEIGFLAIDTHKNKNLSVIYEIYVVKSERRKGYGGWILSEAERIIGALDIMNVRIIPKTLNRDFSQRDLDDWYLRKGYIIHGDNMEKALII